MVDTETPPEGPPSIEQFSDLDRDFLFPKGLEDKALVYFLKYLTGWSKHDKFVRLWAVFGDDMLLFLSIFQGESLRVPPINSLQKMTVYCRIYAFLEARGFSDEGYRACERKFRRKRYHLERIAARVKKVLERLEPISEEEVLSGD